LVATHGHQKEKRDQKGKSLTAYETAHKKARADAKKKKEYEKWMEESSRSAEQHAGKND
jgi:hypothetical protein